MTFYVVADPPAIFDAVGKPQPGRACTRHAADHHGQQVFLTHACVMCHTIRGTRPPPRVGPDLTHLAQPAHHRRRHIAKHASATSAGWISNPQSIKPGVACRPTRCPATTCRTFSRTWRRYDDFDRRLQPQRELTAAERAGCQLERVWREPAGFIGWFKAVHHRTIGKRYIVTAFCFFLLGGILAGVMRLQLAFPEAHFLSNDEYNQFFTMHGSTMMFLFAVPMMLKRSACTSCR